MRQNTKIEQTHKLNELRIGNLSEYSIADLIEIRPKQIKNINGNNNLNIFFALNRWHIVYMNYHTYYELRGVSDKELVDALYKMIVKLKDDCIL